MPDHHGASRREFLKTGLAAGATIASGMTGCGGPGGPYGGYELGFAVWGFRYFTGPEIVAMAKQLGGECLDLGPSIAEFGRDGKRIKGVTPYDKNPDSWRQVQAALREHGVRCDTYGQDISEDMEANRALFKWVKQQGIECLRVAPPPELLAVIEPLVEEFEIMVAVHNHGPTDKHYKTIDDMAAALKNRHPLIGACVDVGHFWRAGEDPVKALEVLGDRVLRVHFKDQEGIKEQAVVGEGKLDIPGIIKMLKKINFAGPLHLEYEDHPDNPMPYIEQCLANMRRMFAEIG
jgi:inosose dehydratase